VEYVLILFDIPQIKTNFNFAGGSPAAGYLLLHRQKKVTQEKATPIRHPFGIPCVARLVRRLRNSHDPLRVHVLKQSSPNSPDQPALLGDGTGEGKTKIQNKRVGTMCPRGLHSCLTAAS
jgi:hypothetical protein